MKRGVFYSALRLGFRLMPMLLVIYGMRDGASSARELYRAAVDLVLLAEAGSELMAALLHQSPEAPNSPQNNRSAKQREK